MARDGSRPRRFTPLVCALVLALAPSASADDFYPGDPIGIGTSEQLSNSSATANNGPERFTPASGVNCEGSFLDHTLWWNFPGNGARVTITTEGSNFDTILGVYENNPFKVCDDDIVTNHRRQSRVRVSTLNGVPYYLQIGGCISAGCGVETGTVVLGVYETPVNDDRSAALNVQPGTPRDVNTRGATAATEDLYCDTSQTAFEKTVWFRFEAPSTGQATFTASGFDTIISVYRGDATAPLRCADDPASGSRQASLTLDVAPGAPYFVQVGGYGPEASGAPRGFGAVNAADGLLTYTASFSDPDPDDDGETGGMDCDETNPARNHHLPEIANNDVDENCDGVVLIDRDSDGSPAGADCNDNQAAETPGKPEIPKNNLDDDCIGGDNKDGDRDGEADKAFGGKDCNDRNRRINTRANEVRGNFVDENCDGRAVPGSLRPVPQFDMSGSAFGNGSLVSEVTAYGVKKGYRVKATCRGRGCPKAVTVKVRRNGSVRFATYRGRRLGAGAVIQVGAWIPRRNVRGEYARFTVRAGNRPKRCFGRLNPPKFRPGRCHRG